MSCLGSGKSRCSTSVRPGRRAGVRQGPGHLGVTCQALGGVQGSHVDRSLASPARLRPVDLTSLLAA